MRCLLANINKTLNHVPKLCHILTSKWTAQSVTQTSTCSKYHMVFANALETVGPQLTCQTNSLANEMALLFINQDWWFDQSGLCSGDGAIIRPMKLKIQ